jgi:hypothetical protein
MLRSKHTPIQWNDVSEVWKDCVYHLVKAIQQKNQSGMLDSDDNTKTTREQTKEQFVDYWLRFVEIHPKMLKVINTEPPDSVLNENESQSSAKKRKSTDLADALDQHTALEKKRPLLVEQRLELNTTAHELNVKCTVAATKQSNANQKVARTFAINKWMQDSNRLTAMHRDLKKQFQDHCKNHLDREKQDHKVRHKSHKERVAERGDDIDSDSDESQDTQAELLNEIDDIGNQLKFAKKELKAAKDWVVVDDDDGNDMG